MPEQFRILFAPRRGRTRATEQRNSSFGSILRLVMADQIEMEERTEKRVKWCTHQITKTWYQLAVLKQLFIPPFPDHSISKRVWEKACVKWRHEVGGTVRAQHMSIDAMLE